MKKRIVPIVLSVCCFLAALGVMLYPAISSYVNEKYRSEIHTAYIEQVQKTDDSSIRDAWDRAVAYNETITPGATSADAYSQKSLVAAAENYGNQLNLAGNSIMGYVEIPAIEVRLPIYHGTQDATLEKGVGHLLGSSLPVGGDSTHSILTGHSGMASQKMFTDLHQLTEGDVFYLHILNEVLAYKVTQVNTVLPYDTSLLGIRQGEDLCTLVTCTPIGLNTHRLLVTGERTAYEPVQTAEEQIEAEELPVISTWETQYWQGIFLGIGAALILGTAVLIYMKLKKHLQRKSK